MTMELEHKAGSAGTSERARRIAANTIVDDDPMWDLKIQRRTLEAASRIRSEFTKLQGELLQAHNEIIRLRKEARVLRACQGKLAGLDTAALRRQAARRLHPDRGGDAVLMTKINTVLDEVELLQALVDGETYLAA